MLYYFTRPLATLAIKIFYKRIYFSGAEKIPTGKPLLIAANHPTAFCEPVILACVFRDVEFNFITRGDIFAQPFYRKCLENLNMIPIFRFRDGYSNLKNNQATMDYVYQALADKKSILIFPEGFTRSEKRLRPLQKGTARMAFGNYERHGDLDLHILPVGLTYTDPHTPRSEVLIEVGYAIPLSQYYADYQQNTNKAILNLTKDLEKAMRPLLVSIEKPADEPILERLLEMYRNTFPEDSIFPIFKKNKRRLEAEREIADNFYQKLLEEERLKLSHDIEDYYQSLTTAKVSDFAVAQPYHNGFYQTMALIIGFLPFCIGYTLHYPAFGYARHIRNTRVRQLEFKAPVQLAVGLGGVLISYFIFLIILIIVNQSIVWAFGLSIPFLGFYAVLYNDFWQRYKSCLPLSKLNQLSDLQQRRLDILEQVRRPKP